MSDFLGRPKTVKKVSYRFDHLGCLLVRLIETMDDGRKLYYYLQPDGAWRQYDPTSEEVQALSNHRHVELAGSGDVFNA